MARQGLTFSIEASLTNSEGQVVGCARFSSVQQAPDRPEGQTGGNAPAAGKMRDVMPHTADLVDWLRGFLGTERANERIAAAKRGAGGFYVAEVGPDGVLREYGSTDDGRRCVLDDQRRIRWADRQGRLYA
jgi:hypothetical protein